MAVTHAEAADGQRGSGIDCCRLNSECGIPDCFQFSLPRNDPFYSFYNVTCHQFTRSESVLECAPGHVSSKQVREQFSQVSHWLDASFLYGSTESANRAVRNFYQGQVSFLDVDTGIHNYQKAPIIKQILPSLTDSESGPFACPAGASTAAHSNPGGCFLAGDERVNQQPLTASLHVLFLRFHNALARAMGGMMGDMGAGLLDEEIFQQARKIVIAVWQNIVYREFLPVLLGPQATADSLYSQAGLELEPLDFGYFLGYDASSNPNVLNEFTTAAFRLHTIMDDSVPRLLFVTGLTEDNPLSTQFNNMTLLYQEGNADAIISGMLEEMALAFDSQMAGELQGKLFRGQHPFGLDLMAIDIQRGRDHGLSSYNEVRKSCGFRRARDFSELSDFMPYHHTKILQQLYRTVEDVDLMVGGLLENVVNEEATVGPTFACIIAMEFRNKRLGDRFWYENPQQFDGGTLQLLRRITMADIICLTTALRYVPKNPFLQVSDRNPMTPCHMLEELRLDILMGK